MFVPQTQYKTSLCFDLFLTHVLYVQQILFGSIHTVLWVVQCSNDLFVLSHIFFVRTSCLGSCSVVLWSKQSVSNWSTSSQLKCTLVFQEQKNPNVWKKNDIQTMSQSFFESCSKGDMLFCFSVEGQDDAWVKKRLRAPKGKKLVWVDLPSQSTSLTPFLFPHHTCPPCLQRVSVHLRDQA